MSMSVVASIPSPSWNSIGPFNAYGLMIALGVLAAVEISRRQFAWKGGDPEDFSTIALWAVPAGVIGARLYHVITDYHRFTDDWVDIFRIRQGGLGIPGGLILGVGVGVYMGRRLGIRLPVGLDCVAPGIAVAAALGRIGNWFNQELYGRASDLPWALEIDSEHAPGGVAGTFHPTFLYEMSWNLLLAAILFRLDRKKVLRPGAVFALFVFGYSLIRFILEFVRIDEATEIFGLRVNIVVSTLFMLGAVASLLMRGRPTGAADERLPYEGERLAEYELTHAAAGVTAVDGTGDDIDLTAGDGDGVEPIVCFGLPDDVDPDTDPVTD